ncbi:hypothetical protein ACS127_00085 [Amphibacillus sp. Q70]|uniref:hypothetical protein n=1 Tax=Amphibacillus sp. Q70 TaxID=3453416 RepID=UPI003F86CDD8
MNKEKLTIPLPNEQTIQQQIDHIVASGMKRNESFFTFVKSMYQQVGMRDLFSDRSELIFVFITAMTLLCTFFIRPESAQADDLYGFIFLISPALFIALSVFTYANKITNATYEVEMACKYNVYQIIAFRMLIFSVLAILVNSITILFFVMTYDDVQFWRAFMISVTGLFIFSVIFLYTLMKRRTTIAVVMIVMGWTAGNILLRYMNHGLYYNILENIPLLVYGIVLIGCIPLHIHLLKKLINFKQAEGVL